MFSIKSNKNYKVKNKNFKAHLPYRAVTILFLLIPFITHATPITPNDTHFNTQYYLKHTKVEEAWEYAVGSDEVVVAVIDSGVDIDHPDLKDNVWVNENEIPSNGLDDDKNGYIDDVNGWNFVENSNDPRPQFGDFTIEGASHGTLVAGIIGAVGHNNRGIAGINWKVKIMPLRALNSKGEGEIPQAIAAIRYATVNGAHVINLSFVGTTLSEELKRIIYDSYLKGVVIVAAVGNDGLVTNGKESGGNLDTRPIYPACFNTPFENIVIGVGAVDKENRKASFSHFGNTCIDINAPAVDIVSTQTLNPKVGTPFNAEVSGFWNGTSFATPQVSGAAALIKSLNKNYTSNQITSFLLDTADSIDEANPAYQGKLGKGVLNVQNALRAAAPLDIVLADPREKIFLKGSNKALFISAVIPDTIPTQTVLPIQMEFKNHGGVTWEYHQMGINISDWEDKPMPFKPTAMPLNNHEILPSQTVPIQILLASPKQHGTYNLKLQLSYKGSPVDGGTFFKKITVTTSLAAGIISDTLPIAVQKKWGAVPVKITIANLGKEQWKKGDTRLVLESKSSTLFIKQQGREQILFKENAVPPQKSATFLFTLHFKNTERGAHHYTLLLEKNGKVERIEGGERVIRVD